MYLQLPIMAAVRFKVSDGMNLVVNAGPYLAYGIGGKAKFENEGESEKMDFFDNSKKFDFGLGVGVTAEFGKIFVGLDGAFGLTKLAEMEEGSLKNQTFGLSVGYKF